MRKTSKAANADPAHKQAVIYARVSSKEQEKEVFSIPAQRVPKQKLYQSSRRLLFREFSDGPTCASFVMSICARL
jgi:hypothetical protein